MPIQDNAGRVTGRTKRCIDADAGHGSQYIAAINEWQRVALPGWNAGVVKQSLERTTLPTRGERDPFAAFALADGDGRRRERSRGDAFALRGRELQHTVCQRERGLARPENPESFDARSVDDDPAA